MNDHRVDIGNIQSGLNNGRGHQHIDFPVYEIIHDPLQFTLLHLSVGKCHGRLGHQFLNGGSNIRDIIYPVIDIVHLSFPGQFPDNRLPHQFFVILTDKCLDRMAVSRRLLKHAHIADTDQAHVQCSRNGRRRQRQHIHIFFHFLDLLFMRHTETLLLIYNKQPQILILHIRRQYPVGADHDVHHTLL